MVSVRLVGGLGNMMFQIAFIEDLARRGGFEVRYPPIGETFAELLESGHSKNCYDYLNIFKNLDWLKNQDKPMPTKIIRIPYHYEYVEPVDDVIYYGYFQSERYFDREETLKLFEPNDGIEHYYEFGYNTCSIHYRKGDYITKYSDTYEIPSDAYYGVAMRIIDAHEYYVFSDEKSHYATDYEDLFMMSSCDHHIIANSSFSWWGAYLNQNPDKKVIAPAKWYKPGCKYSADDIYCKNMIII